MPWSHSGVNIFIINADAGKACVRNGQPSSSSRMGVSEEMDVEIWFLDNIFGPPVGWRSARSRVATFRGITDLHAGVLSLRAWKTSYIGQRRNMADARCRQARAVTPRAPSQFRICVHERIAVPQ